MGIDHWLTMAYHLQENGQTEWTNQTIEQYLQHYISYEQDDWDKFLSMAQFAFNNAIHSTTKDTLFYINYGYNPSLYREPRPCKSLSESAKETVEKLKNLHTQLKNDIDFMNLQSMIYTTSTMERDLSLKEGRKYSCSAEILKQNNQVKSLTIKRLDLSRLKKNLDQWITNWNYQYWCNAYIQYSISCYWNQHQRTSKSQKTSKLRKMRMNMKLNKFWNTNKSAENHFIWSNGKAMIPQKHLRIY